MSLSGAPFNKNVKPKLIEDGCGNSAILVDEINLYVVFRFAIV